MTIEINEILRKRNIDTTVHSLKININGQITFSVMPDDDITLQGTINFN